MRSYVKHVASIPFLSLFGVLFFSVAAGVFALMLLPSPSAPVNANDMAKNGAISVSGVLLFGGIGVVLVFSGKCREIVADPVGLRWRLFPGIGAWRAARWEEVTDFYLQENQTRWVVQTERDTLSFTRDHSPNLTALAEFIAARAMRPPYREWQERGFRSGENWPIIFEYGSEDAVMLFGAAILVALPTLSFTAFSAFGMLHRIREQGWSGGIGIDLLVGTGTFLLFAAAIGFMVCSGWKNMRRSDRIAVDEHGIAWIRKTGTVEAEWPQIHSVYSRIRNGILETSSGRIEYTTMIQDAPLLQRLIRHFAAEALARGQEEHPRPSMLVGAPEVRPNEAVFVYRTMLNFAGVCIPTFFTVLFLFASAQESVRRWWPDWDAHFTRSTPAELAASNDMAVLMALLSLWLWQRMLFGKIVVNEDTITQYAPFGVRALKWWDIQAVTPWKPNPAFCFYLIQEPSARLIIWTGISDVRKLEAEINRRIPDNVPKVRLLPAACYDEELL